jgi:GR25 family glycosyltransferase involved in LPS biosynthesis
MSFINYIITIRQETISQELAQDCANSCQEHNQDYQYFDAVYRHNLAEIYKENSLRVYTDEYLTGPKNYTTSGTMGCSASHYLLWKLARDSNQTICVLEHDALWIRPFDLSLLDHEWDVLHLDWRSNKVDDYYQDVLVDHGNSIASWRPGWGPITRRPFKRLKQLSISGSHAYLIRPQGAVKLLDQADAHGILPSDVHYNSVFCDLKYTETSYCKINPKYFVPKANKKSHTVDGFTTRNW